MTSERRRFIATGGGLVAAAVAGAIVDAPNVIAQPKIHWRMSTGFTKVFDILLAAAQRLGRILAGLMPEDAEVLGLLALMEIQASRQKARSGPDGAFIPITEQDRARWDQLLIRRGLEALARAEALGGDGPYVL